MFPVSKPANDGSFRERPAASQPRQALSQTEETSAIYRETGITIQFLPLVNESTYTRDTMRAATAFFQRQSGCDAVCVSLQEGEGFPDLEEPRHPSR
jgi:hypothetical protein